MPKTFNTRYADWALQKMDELSRCVDIETGVAAPIVNPLEEGQRSPLNGPSPECQAFTALLYAARRDWEKRARKICSHMQTKLVSMCLQVVPLRVRDGLLDGVLGGVGLLELSPRLGLIAASGTDNNVSEPREGHEARFPAEMERT